MQLPNGLTFYLPQTKWTPRNNSSFQGITEALYFHLKGNPNVLKQLGWELDMGFLADKVDEFNAKIAEANGWSDYITEAAGGRRPTVPFNQSQSVSGLDAVSAGLATINEMFGPEGPVAKDLAEDRAAVCAGCPKNHKADNWLSLVTVPVANLTRKMLGIAKDMDLTTSIDSELVYCQACQCPLRLKVWARIAHITAHMPEDVKANLDPRCWVISESETRQ